MSILEVNCDNLQNNPKCAHGPTLKFSRLVKGRVKRFFACSACRDRKDCPFFLWEDEPISDSKLLSWAEVRNKSISSIDHDSLQKRLKIFKNLDCQNRKFCLSCFDFVLKNEENVHKLHIIKNNITNDVLLHPSLLIAPSTKNKKEAQFWFSDNSKQFIVNNIINLNTESVLCIGAPTIYEQLRNKNFKSLLLDIDYRFHWFYDSQEFCWFNMFNCHFFSEEESSKQLLLQNLQFSNIIVVIDPPFGARIEPLKKTIETFQSLTASRIQIILILPYFMEPQILTSFPDFKILDYPIEYLNHNKFNGKVHNTLKKSSPVRIFTNIPPKNFIFPKHGYYFCNICEAWRSVANTHCSFCETCPSKNGDVYNHCFVCKKCFKKTWIHCNKCKRCCLSEHACEENERNSFKKKRRK
ncbi:rRNA N6-adenosine-methyltransferase ZCCHC4 isoform X1 [Halyomorpha halys]|uniref:rRNA N6-adenosine-methyltransferase ZCCHC4 isoform X1 n=1 Tax=Halyomorpha halys TaxID=286706 RepID=UPI0006D51BC7|nr:zinc finger CCHC domain-containing protein 4 isoform X1 [Halyomorpha halys]XP_014291205.1 zinc finger CCHC domain-containing protein 4 isoform X2 [Halyomorpha halys]